MGKTFNVSRSVESRVIGRPTQQAGYLLDQLDARGRQGPCENCVFYRGQPGLYCLRYGDCFPETKVLWRERVEGVTYGHQDTRCILEKGG